MRALVLSICLFPGLAAAGSLHRCVNHVGHVSYQSTSCGAGQRTDRIIEYVPDSVLAVPNVGSTSGNKPLASKSRRAARAGYGSLRRTQPSPCMQAKAKRDLQLKGLGLKRTFDDLSRIDAQVRAACKGF